MVFIFVVMVSESASFSQENIDSKAPVFFLFNKVELKSEANIDEEYIDNLLNKMGEKPTEDQALSIPVSLIDDDLSPPVGQKIWGFFYSDDHGLRISPDKISTVTGYQIQGDDNNGNSISFQTDVNPSSPYTGAIYVLKPKDTLIESEKTSLLSSKEVNELISKFPKTYFPVGENIRRSLDLNKWILPKNNLKLSLKVGNFKIIQFIKTKGTGMIFDKACFVDLGKKIVVFNNCYFLNVLKIGKSDYFIMDDTNWYQGELSVYKLNGETFELVKRDGFSTD